MARGTTKSNSANCHIVDGTRCVVRFRCGNPLGEMGCVVFLMASLQLQVPC